MSNLQFITCLFGERYLPFLVTNLYSLRKHHPESMYVVAYGDISEEVIDPIRFAYPEAMFVRMDIKIQMKENKSRLNNKLAFWWNAYQNKFAENVCFIDVDTLIVRPIPSNIFDQDFDIGVTYCDNENPKFPINTGVFLAKRTEETDILMKSWLRRTNAFINVPKSFSVPFKKYGSGDQLALMLALGEPKRYRKITWHKVDSHKVRCLWLPTTEYNNSYSTSVTRDIHILHYKSRWHSILLDSVPMESIETRKEYGEIYDFYQKAKTEAYSVLG